MQELLRRQWTQLRTWLEAENVLSMAEEESGVGEWTIRELVVHLGYGLRMVAEVVSAPQAAPIQLIHYVRGYAPARTQISFDTRSIATDHRGAELATIDLMAASAWKAIAAGLPPVVQGRRGPIRAEDFLLTRLVELVTHGDDLHRNLGEDRDTPLIAPAVARVADVLTSGYQDLTGRPPQWSGLAFIRRATGRVPADDPHLPLLA